MSAPVHPRDEPVLAAAASAPGGVLACVNLHNFKPLNVVVGYLEGDRILAQVLAALGALGRGCWRTRGDEFVVLLDGGSDRARDTLRAFCWTFHRRVAATEAWRIVADDPRCEALIRRAEIAAVMTPRCGLAAVGADPAAALDAARADCEAHAQAAFEAGHRALASGPWAGFPPLARGLGPRRVLAERCCPRCAAQPLELLAEDLGRAHERCPRCGLTFWRIDALIVDGEVQEGGHA